MGALKDGRYGVLGVRCVRRVSWDISGLVGGKRR